MSVTNMEKTLPESNSEVNSDQAIVHQDPPPDGGWLAWSQVFAGHLMSMNSYGYINSFGFFLSFYTTDLHESPSTVSWVGSIQAFIILFVAAWSGRAVDAGYFYYLVVTGLVLQLVGIFTTSFISEYWQLLLAQGICQGLGSGLMFTPVMVVVSSYFTTRRAVAMCGLSSGSAIGGVIYPLIARQLLGQVGIGWTIRIIGFISLFNAAIILALIKPRASIHNNKKSPIIALASFRNTWFITFALGMFMVVLGLYFVYFYVTSYAEDVLSAPSNTSLTFLLAMNAAGVPGRIIPSYLSDKYVGPQNMLVMIVALTGMLVYVWAGIHSLNGLWGLVIAYGLVSANIQSLVAPILASAGRDPTKFGAELGMIFTVMSLGYLAGPPIAGALIVREGGKYLSAQMFAGSAITCGVLLLIASRVMITGWKWVKC